MDDERLLPVLVYMYGGGFFLGSGSEHKIYDGSYLAQRKNVLVVNFNYRLGALGFLVSASHGIRGNFGIYDQRMAMEWVHRNIAR